jgi:hypothetical protein
VESTAQDDDFQEVKRRKKHISNNTSQTAKKSTKPVPTTEAENTQPEQEAPNKSGRPPPIVMTSTTNLIRLQTDLKEHDKGEYEFRNTRMEPLS